MLYGYCVCEVDGQKKHRETAKGKVELFNFSLILEEERRAKCERYSRDRNERKL